MVMQSQSKLMAKYGAKLDAAAKRHAMDEPDYGFQRVPPGITKGVARLVECKFDEYKTGQNKGELYFRAAGVVVEPAEVMMNGTSIDPRGMQTSVMVAVCDTKTVAGKLTTIDEHVAEIQNHMKILGASPEDLAGGGAALEPLANALKAAQPFFHFSTSVRKGQPYFDAATKTQKQGEDGVWENWYGIKGLESYVPPEPGDVVDNSANGQVIPDPNAEQPVEPQTEVAGDQQPPADEQQGDAQVAGNPMDADGALSELATRADAGEEAAANELFTFAVGAGVNEDWIRSDEVQSWSQVVEAIGLASQQPAEPEPAPSPPPPVKPAMVKPAIKPATPPATVTPSTGPVKGKVYKWNTVDLKTKKPKVVQVECMVSYPKTQTADVKNLTDGKTIHKSVKWADLK